MESAGYENKEKAGLKKYEKSSHAIPNTKGKERKFMASSYWLPI